MTDVVGLDFSIPANNQKIIEIYNKLRSGLLSVNKDYQRKLVWKRPHKINFIDTILKNYPFPEIYLAPGALDQEKLILIDEIVDGQQRLTTIRDYIEGTDIFALPNLPIRSFSSLSPSERTSFLNYEVSVRYLKNVSPEQVREIFQRINRTDYALNATEKINAQWGSSEFVCFCKQLIENNFESESVQYVMDEKDRSVFVKFFHGEDEEDEPVFSETDMSRMYALQYIMTLVATIDSGEYFARTDKVQSYIVGYNEAFSQAEQLKTRLLKVVAFIESLNIPRFSRWYKKANLFSLMVELDKVDVALVDRDKLKGFLESLDLRATLSEFGLQGPDQELNADENQYISYAREAVNQRAAREYRGKFLSKLIHGAMPN